MPARAIAVLLQPQHAGARGRRERGLAAGEEGRQQQADHDDDESESQSFAVMSSCLGELLREEGAHLGGVDVVRDESLRRCRAPG